MQTQISWLLQKPTDLDLHCSQRQGISGFSRTRVKISLLGCKANFLHFVRSNWAFAVYAWSLKTPSCLTWSTYIVKLSNGLDKTCIFNKNYWYSIFVILMCTYNIHKLTNKLTLVLLNPDIPCLCKQCRPRSVGFWRSQLILICTVCHVVCEFITTIQIKKSDWLKIRSGCGILIYSAGQGISCIPYST